jgi:16S rRNA (cytosine1402-N4)-methyltransferase
MARAHEPVLLAEALAMLAVKPGGLYVDGTVGLGGHAAAILDAGAPDARLLGFDRDAETMEHAREALARHGDRVRFVHADFREIPAQLGGQRADGILLDLGVSSVQLDTAERGFSFQADGPLDMRMDRSSGETAADVVNEMDEEGLANVIYEFGEDRASRKIARAIVSARRQHRIETTGELAAIVRRASGRPSWKPGIDSATRTFQALRIHVNRELEGLGAALEGIAGVLAPGGRLAVIAFHSLEDREVKQTFRSLASRGYRLLTKKPIRPGEEETRGNPRSRSARLRGIAREEAVERPDREAA